MAILRKYDGFVTLIDTSTPGTYTIENPVDTIAEIAIVGAGGGGVGCAHGSTWYYADGGGGAAFVGVINLPAGTHTVTVGLGGASNFNASSASDAGSVTGGDSSLGDLIIAGGGIRGSGTNCVYPGAGGTLTVNADVISADIQSNGNNATGGGTSGHGQAQSLYQDYGKGGMGIYGGSVAGTNGYVKVRIKVSGSKIKAYTIMRRNKAYNIVDPSWVSGSQTFNYTGALQTYTVPEGVTSIQVDCVGAKGYTASLAAGLGGRVKTKLTVTPGQELKVWVGQAHSQITTPEYNASDIRTSSAGVTSEEGLLSRLIVAGGGGDGSQTNWQGGEGGHGGGLIGGSSRAGYGTEATGGTQTAGGTGGTHGAVYGGGSGQGYPGTFGLGGATKKHDASYSGCGGAGWYGGGGGSVCSVNKKYYVNGVAGAGGSSYTDPELCSEVSHTQGFNDGNGYVKISYKRRRF